MLFLWKLLHVWLDCVEREFTKYYTNFNYYLGVHFRLVP